MNLLINIEQHQGFIHVMYFLFPLIQDDCGQFPYNANIQIHWVSFLDGRQRVLLFTDDVALVSKARQAEELEQPDQEINLSIHSLGLSLVNNENKKEISYIGITRYCTWKCKYSFE